MFSVMATDYSPSSDIHLVCFDLDGTLIDRTVYIWSTLHEFFGSDPVKRKQAADSYHQGKITYAEWFFSDLELLKARDADRQGMLRAFGNLVPAPGARETLSTLKERGYRLGLISGSLDLVLEHFLPEAPFDHVLINQATFDEKGRITGGIPTAYDLEGKARGLEELARREGLETAQCAFIGDNTNDLSVMRVAGFSVGVNIKSPEIAKTADLVLSEPDLRALLPYFPGRPGRVNSR